MTPRLPAHIEISGLIRTVSNAGGFATVLSKGEKDAGTLLIICCENGTNARFYERMPRADGTRGWMLSKAQDSENPHEFGEYCQRRGDQDPDCWIVELDIADAERFIDMKPPLD